MRKLRLVNVHLCLFPLVFPSEIAELLGSAFHCKAFLAEGEETFPVSVSMSSSLTRCSFFPF